MDKEPLHQDDQYRVFVPIEDHDLLKSVDVDENGDYIVQGVMTTDDVDEQDDAITPDGMDCSYFLEKGWVKYEHGKNPNQFIGEPLEVRVGRFEHPTLKKAVNGIFVKARLFANRELTKQAIEAINDLEKSHTKRRMGWSIEGSVVKRHSRTGKIVKSVLRNVVLTMNPVNTTTWAELAKSFAGDHELTIDTDVPIDKAMDIQTAQAITPQSLEGAKKDEEDPQQEWINLYRSIVKKALIEKAFRSSFIESPEQAELESFKEALEKGFDFEEAEEFASYIADNHTLLKSAIVHFGGDSMGKSKAEIASLLDADLAELKKAIATAEGEEEEDLFKSVDEGDEDESSEDEDEDEGSSEGDDEGDEEGSDSSDDDEDGEDGMEKSLGGSSLRKSLAEEHGQAFEVSDFLTAIADEIGFTMEGVEKSIMGVTKTQHTMVKAFEGMAQLVKSMSDELSEVRAENQELTKSFGEIMQRPVGRKGVVNQREVQTLQKSMGGEAPSQPLTKSQIVDTLIKSFEAGDIPGSAITRFEGGVPLNQLNLPNHLQKSLGLN